MSAELFDLEELIAQLEARRAAFNTATDDAISSLRRLFSFGTTVNMAALAAPTTPGAGTAAHAPDEYYGLSVADAAKKYLRTMRRKLTNKEIAEGLDSVGYIHNSKDLPNNVGTALWRAEHQGDQDLVRHGRYWLLTEWGVRKRPTPKKIGTFTEIPQAARAETSEDESED